MQHEQPAGAALARLLRQWWEQSAHNGVEKPTQQSLARHVGVDQTTLSRYLNPRHPSTAPLRVVELLHSHLGAPAGELARARALHREATAAARRRAHRTTAPDGAGDSTPPGPAEAPGAGPERSGHSSATSSAAGHRTRVRQVPAWPLAAAATFLLLVGVGVWWWAAAPSGNGWEQQSPSPAASATEWQLTQEGDRYWKAWTVQYLLAAHGHEVQADGIFGKKTAAAVRRFQKERGLLPDGKVGPRTWPLLVRTVDSGSHGPEVEALQHLLTNAGLPTDITGTYSATTAHNLTEFQEAHRLPVTGEADVATWRALMDAQQPPVRSHPTPTPTG
ncbi:peptidoglycan-binding protein [Streptomyces sp. enrichment culture]|uniref:peptidoglycan-binding protein n=1 Tax=Streptomyces sp. enrichment culture TaxID=1795815 RepID=UPI003F56A99E